MKSEEEIIDEYLELKQEEGFEWIFNVPTQKWRKEVVLE